MKIQKLAVILTITNLVLLILVLAQIRPVGAQDIAPVLRGRALKIVDQRGQVRAQINIEPSVTMPDGQTYPEAAVFRMRDPKGFIRVKLGADQEGSGLVLADDSQQPGVHILAKGDGSFLRVVNKNGREQLVKP